MDAPGATADETSWRRGALTMAIAVTLIGGWYLGQVFRTSEWDVVPLAIAFAFAEVFSVASLVSLCWTVARHRTRAHRPAVPQPVDVLVPTIDEPIEVLEPTVRAALDLDWPDRVRVVVLDDGGRPEIADLADRMGADYLARDDRRDAKSGNLNAGLAHTARSSPAPIVAVFDADHVAVPEFLHRTVGHLGDDVALVQTPQYYRLDGTRAVQVAAEQQLLLCDRIGPSRDAYGTMFCMGTNYVVRRDALDAIGGYPKAITEDVMVSLELLRTGRRVAYVHEPLAIGLAPPTLAAFIRQQTRWALGSLEFATRRRDLLAGIGPLAAWQYASLPLHWFYGITFPIYLLIALAGVVGGWHPFLATNPVLVGSQLAWLGAGAAGLLLTARGVLGFDACLVKWGTYVVTFRALRQYFTPERTASDVAQKVRGASEPTGSPRYVHLSLAIVAVMVVALALRGYQASLAGPLLASGSNAAALLWLAIRFRDDDRRRLGVAAAPATT